PPLYRPWSRRRTLLLPAPPEAARGWSARRRPRVSLRARSSSWSTPARSSMGQSRMVAATYRQELGQMEMPPQPTLSLEDRLALLCTPAYAGTRESHARRSSKKDLGSVAARAEQAAV